MDRDCYAVSSGNYVIRSVDLNSDYNMYGHNYRYIVVVDSGEVLYSDRSDFIIGDSYNIKIKMTRRDKSDMCIVDCFLSDGRCGSVSEIIYDVGGNADGNVYAKNLEITNNYVFNNCSYVINI